MSWGDDVQSLFGAMAGLGQAQQPYYDPRAQRGCGTISPGGATYIDNSNSSAYLNLSPPDEPEPEKVSEFKQLSNHKFHELLDKFKRWASTLS